MSNINKIIIPSSVTKIEDFAFNECTKLKTIEISDDSQIRSIGKCSFNETDIDCFTIPSHVNEIKEAWITGCTKVNVNPLNPNFKEFDDGKIIVS